MIGPARASNPDSPITVARQCVLRRYQQHHRGRLTMGLSCSFFEMITGRTTDDIRTDRRWEASHSHISPAINAVYMCLSDHFEMFAARFANNWAAEQLWNDQRNCELLDILKITLRSLSDSRRRSQNYGEQLSSFWRCPVRNAWKEL